VAHLAAAARAAGVSHVVMMSIFGARPDHPLELFRAKYVGEQALKASGLSATILRPTAFMELWLSILTAPLAQKRQALVFGQGDNPINMVSVDDVARFVLLGLRDPLARGETIEVGGPQNLSLNQIVALVEHETGASVRTQRIPLPMLRMMSVLARPVNPSFARRAEMSAYMDTHDMTFDPTPTLERFPGSLRRMSDVAHDRFGSTSATSVRAVAS
jgi:NADH dehydrogenase